MAVLGCIADDFTGASDAASFLVKGGMSVRLYNGIPDQPALEKGPDRHHSSCRFSCSFSFLSNSNSSFSASFVCSLFIRHPDINTYLSAKSKENF